MIGVVAIVRALPIVWQLAIAAGGIAAVGGGYAYWHHKVDQRGYDRAIAEITHQDTEAVNAALQARARRRACIDGGGVWDVTTGQCPGR